MYFVPYVTLLEKEGLVVGICDVPRELFLPQEVLDSWPCLKPAAVVSDMRGSLKVT